MAGAHELHIWSRLQQGSQRLDEPGLRRWVQRAINVVEQYVPRAFWLIKLRD
jgi:hypothetical protein